MGRRTVAVIRRRRDGWDGWDGIMREFLRQKGRRMVIAHDPRFDAALTSIFALSRHVVIRQDMLLPS